MNKARFINIELENGKHFYHSSLDIELFYQFNEDEKSFTVIRFETVKGIKVKYTFEYIDVFYIEIEKTEKGE